MKTEADLTVFYPARSVRILMLGFSIILGVMALLFTLLPVFAGVAEEDWVFSLLFGLFLAYMTVPLAIGTFRTRLVFSASGVEYADPVFSLKCGWDDVERIGEITTGARRVEGLMLKKPMLKANKWFPGALRVLAFASKDWNRFIGFRQFSRNWRDSGLRAEIERHAPHLLW